MIPQDLKMRREPRQQRTLEIIEKIEQATLALLKESGISQLNTNAIAERCGIDIKSLYRFFPNKEAIVYRLVQQWLEEIRTRETAIYQGELGLIETWNALDDMIDLIEQQFSGYSALWQAMDLIPAPSMSCPSCALRAFSSGVILLFAIQETSMLFLSYHSLEVYTKSGTVSCAMKVTYT